MDQECQLFPWNLCAEFCAYKNSLRAVLRLSVIGVLSAIRARADTCIHLAILYYCFPSAWPRLEETISLIFSLVLKV